MRIQFSHTLEDIISIENLLEAWKEFIKGKRKKQDVQEFQMFLIDNIFALHRDLASHAYRHGGYHAFNISDPKPRIIHKASVRDRLLHHAIHRVLYPFFDRTFIADSHSCRAGKGTHRALNRFREFGYIVSKNNTRTCWVLKCDIRKFFASIDQDILLGILKRSIPDENIVWLLERVIRSFASTAPDKPRNTTLADPLCGSKADAAKVDIRGKGLPLGNLTSQLLANVYMNELDQFVKHKLKIKRYIRYADDFVLLSEDRTALEWALPFIDAFLREKLKLELHPQKVFYQNSCVRR